MESKLTFRIDKHEIEITKPHKVLIQPGTTKLDFVDYYKKVGKRIMLFGESRPISILRFPEGFPGDSFFQRNKPKWVPSWIKHKELGIYTKADYILLDNVATLLWLVNIGSLEFHLAQVVAPNFQKPDVLVFDLDPPTNYKFSKIRDFALHIKPLIESFGYTTFVKTSGKNGIHIYCPIHPRWSFDEVFEAAKEIGEYIVGKINETTLNVSKKKRLDKILVDIYRNHSYQSMIMPYSIRATPSANVSMPLRWKDLKKVKSPSEFTIKTIPEWIKTHKDPWKKMASERVNIHL